jgi:putative hydrolase of the HAD superfamily
VSAARPKVLLLDLGNVTVRLRSAEFLAGLEAACDPALRPLPLHEILQDPASGHRAYERGRIDGPAYFSMMRQRLGLSLDYPAFVRLWNDYFAPNRPMEALVARLRGQVRFWALSNTNALHLDHLKLNYRVFDAFEGITASHEVGACKPEAAIYQAALAALGVEGPEVLYLDDVEDYVRAAEAFGIRGFHYTFNDAALRERLLELGFSLPSLDGSSSLGCA